MFRFRFSPRLLTLSLTVWIAFGSPRTSQAQFLKPGKTALAPEFRGVTDWINSDPLTMAKLRGKVVLLSFRQVGEGPYDDEPAYASSHAARLKHRPFALVAVDSPDAPIRNRLGVGGSGAAILIDATVIRLVMLPAILVLLGDRVWWPSLPTPPEGETVVESEPAYVLAGR